MQPAQIDIVKNFFSLFKAGNIAALFAELDDNVRWSAPQPNYLPWGGDREGKYAVGHYFAMLKEHVEVMRLEPLKLISEKNSVVAVGYSELKMRETGKKVSYDWAMVFTVEDGIITRLQEYADVYDVIEALKKSPCNGTNAQ